MSVLAIDAATYHADLVSDVPTLSASIVKRLLISPKHAWHDHPKLNPYYVREDDPKFSVGTVAHAVLLEGKDVVEIIEADDWRTNAAKDAAKIARDHGKIPLLGKHYFDVLAMVEAAQTQLDAHEASPPLFKDGRAEVTLVWDEGGVTCRARLDWLHDDMSAIDDLKTTKLSASPAKFERSIFNLGYDVQAAFYLRGLASVSGGVGVPVFRFAVVETSPPFALSVVTLNETALAVGDAKVQYALDLWRGCLERGEWPAYSTSVHEADAPPWELRWLDNHEEFEEAAWAAM